MSTVTRYDCITGVEGCPEMDPFGLGAWVAFDDYEKLEAELATLRKAAQNYYECQDLVSWVQDVEGIKQAAEKALLVALKEKGE